MSDHKRGVPVTLDRERWLFYSVKDVKEVWAYTAEEHEPLEQLIHVLHIGLRKDDPSLIEEELSELVGMNEVRELNAKVAEAMGAKPEGIKDDVTVPLASSVPTSQG